MFNISSAQDSAQLLDALGDQLAQLNARYEVVVDQIHFKLYATVDQGPGKHEADLRALDPTADELLAAARWTRPHDPSEGYRSVLLRVLAAFGVEDAALGT